MKVVERTRALELRELALGGRGLLATPLTRKHQAEVRPRARVVGLAREHAPEGALGGCKLAVPYVQHAEGVVRTHERRIHAYRLARPPIAIVEPAAHQRLGRPIVHEHGDDGGLLERAGTQPAQLARRNEIDGDRLGGVVQGARIGVALAQRHIDVPVQEIDVAVAAPHVSDRGLVVRHLQPQLLRESPGHDDERQAVAAARVERLGGRARARAVVLELELALRHRVDQRLAYAVAADRQRELLAQEAPHRIAHRKDVRPVDALGRRREQRVLEELFRRRREHRLRGASREEQGSDRGGGTHALSHLIRGTRTIPAPRAS
ncbi:MAG TPA: hypothetical protein VFJ70_00660 [Burkholderiales bacterium]|nr:hypothetical protein [Burkholderiales bacterium]